MDHQAVLVLEADLIWSSKLSVVLKGLAIPFRVESRLPNDLSNYAVAIVSLGSRLVNPKIVIPALLNAKIPVIAHAGHKESELLQLGKDLHATQVVTNGSLARSLPTILRQFLQESL